MQLQLSAGNFRAERLCALARSSDVCGPFARLVRHVGLSSRSGPFVRAVGSQRTASGPFYALARIAHASQHICFIAHWHRP